MKQDKSTLNRTCDQVNNVKSANKPLYQAPAIATIVPVACQRPTRTP
jgi:hypothetical protein